MKSKYLFCLLFLLVGCENVTENNHTKLEISFQNTSTHQLNKLTISNKFYWQSKGKIINTVYFI